MKKSIWSQIIQVVNFFAPSEKFNLPGKRPRQQQDSSELGGKLACSVPSGDPAPENPPIEVDQDAPT